MKVLIIVDMQNDFVGGALGTQEAQAIVPSVESKVRQFSEKGLGKIIFTRDTHWADYAETQEGKMLPVPHCLIGSDGWKIIPQLHSYLHDRCAHAVNKGSFGYDDWADEFGSGKSIESFELAGVCTDICLVSNALILKALYPEIPIYVDASCCAGTTPKNHAAALQVMKSCQIHVIGE